jgi:hypothetical protein
MSRLTGLTLDSYVMRNPDQMSTDLAGDTVLMRLDTGRYYGMRATAGRIWELLAEPRRVGSICDALLAEYAVERDRCEHEVLAFLTELIREELILPVDGGG